MLFDLGGIVQTSDDVLVQMADFAFVAYESCLGNRKWLIYVHPDGIVTVGSSATGARAMGGFAGRAVDDGAIGLDSGEDLWGFSVSFVAFPTFVSFCDCFSIAFEFSLFTAIFNCADWKRMG